MIYSNIQNRTKLLVILGPTATGKTDLALSLAKKFNGELVSCDSRQVYKGLDIGTGKMPNSDLRFKIYDLGIQKGKEWWEINGVRVWMYDVVNPKIQYTVAGYVQDASGIIWDIQDRGKLPIIVGGTGLYLKALIEGLSNLSIPIDKKLRQQLEKLSVSRLQEKLKEISSEKWKKMNYSDQQNPRRLVRAIELAVIKPNNRFKIQDSRFKNFDILKIGLTAKREVLYQRADERVVGRINQGMIEEAERLRSGGLSLERMRQLGLEYGVLADYLDGKIKNKQQLTRILQERIHNYIRRQLTWFKKEKDVNWFDMTTKNLAEEVEKKVGIWYHH